MQPRTLTYNALELRPAKNSIAICQGDQVVTITLDQLHQFTSDICSICIFWSMRHEMSRAVT